MAQTTSTSTKVKPLLFLDLAVIGHPPFSLMSLKILKRAPGEMRLGEWKIFDLSQGLHVDISFQE
jgi:hypothetical protein